MNLCKKKNVFTYFGSIFQKSDVEMRKFMIGRNASYHVSDSSFRRNRGLKNYKH